MTIVTSDEIKTVIAALSAEFPREQISWRAQNLKADGSSALALAFIDSRDVQNRLDDVVGANNWSNKFNVFGDKTVCALSVRIGGEWIAKEDGAGNTDVEAEKGSLSDALKRSAVLWGIGRYLYAIPAPWVPCDSWKDKNDKLRWSKWKADPWDYVKTAPKPAQGLAGGKAAELATSAAQPHWKAVVDALDEATTVQQLNGAFERHRPVYDLFPGQFQEATQEHYYARREALGQAKPVAEKSVAEFEAGKALARSEKPYAAKPETEDLPLATRIAQTP